MRCVFNQFQVSPALTLVQATQQYSLSYYVYVMNTKGNGHFKKIISDKKLYGFILNYVALNIFGAELLYIKQQLVCNL